MIIVMIAFVDGVGLIGGAIAKYCKSLLEGDICRVVNFCRYLQLCLPLMAINDEDEDEDDES